MDVDDYIRKNNLWSKLPLEIKQIVGTSLEYDKKIVEYSIKNQLRYRGNLVRHVIKNEKNYYDELLKYSREHYMLFPYHLSDFIVTGMRITPFQYYQSMVQDLLDKEKNYDTLPNFTAADCLRLLGIGRNQYIDIMNQCRSTKKFLGMIRKPVKDLLPNKPVKEMTIDPWWLAYPGYITEDDVKLMVTINEKEIIDSIVSDEASFTPLKCGDVEQKAIRSLYLKGLIFLEVPIEDDDLIVVPPLEGFVMNRVTGDYFETLLYKIFVSIDEKTTVLELANVLQIDLPLVKNAISMYCRLGFAYKKGNDTNPNQYHPSWRSSSTRESNSAQKSSSSHSLTQNESAKSISQFVDSLAIDENNDVGGVILDGSSSETASTISADDQPSPINTNSNILTNSSVTNCNSNKRIALLYDSTLPAFLMMGNLSPGLKNHAVTMFEVGKLPDESIDSLLLELSKISDMSIDDDGTEAERYFLHAIILYRTIQFLRHNPVLTSSLVEDQNDENKGLGLDLIRCESLLNLEEETCQRLLHKNYKLIISVAPLSNETRVITSQSLPHLGGSPLVNSAWFKLFIYFTTGYGPHTLLLSKGARLSILPQMFEEYDSVMITPWGRDSGIIPISNALMAINEACTYSPVLVQAYPESDKNTNSELIYLPLPLIDSTECAESDTTAAAQVNSFENHFAVKAMAAKFNLSRMCGYITLIKLDEINQNIISDSNDEFNCWTLFDCHFGIPLFDRALNKQVSSRIVNNKLCDSERLQEVIETNQQLCLDIESFINEHQLNTNSQQLNDSKHDQHHQHQYAFPAKSKYDTVVPFPAKSFLFCDGNLSEWK